MTRDGERQREVPAFSLGIGELEILWKRLLALFEHPDKVHGSISITLPTETLKFDNPEELKRFTQLRGRITTFWIYLSQDSRTITIRSHSGIFHSSRTIVRAIAENGAWYAGAVDTVYSFLQSYKVWYHWLVPVPLGLIVVLLCNAPNIALLFFPRETVFQIPKLAPWLTMTLALGILWLTRGKLLPSSTLRISEDEGFIRRHVGELSLIVALIGLVLMVLQLFIGK